MDENEQQLFNQLAEDENFLAAHAEHEAAFGQRECMACKFFQIVHDLRHFADVVDVAKVIDMCSAPVSFVTDAQVIIGFLSETTRYFLESEVGWDEEEDDEDWVDEEEEEDE